ncbi:hypothetical protein Achl_3357 [Pseudarthrobacter chlorophenolicus A6]|uniref:Uncharacterized protein n=1 Tax=Pseudarthrobacter chlorophenolicus (strain ATCC 700700 / DSM 12829 / CIP 107037 / JCM 12360 / KCTC 9906 / NCIMB 13794 / A6) TaxID=452863 RepID=B8HGP8_PSECP|nr:hypothetical protein [Pseudarthrobacter chlorophenolicus]ACL41314.1 hypothetical protein Achl_3357 [Pseudarthrobacter chlorophenolicus A6]SDQ66404.1 hypothetical protein SAMN04489738_2122 [Pseudarthrobacter chlorophenolicus]
MSARVAGSFKGSLGTAYPVGGSGGLSCDKDGKVTEVTEFQEDTAKAADFWT